MTKKGLFVGIKIAPEMVESTELLYYGSCDEKQEPVKRIKTILVPTDLSDLSLAALEVAAVLACGEDAKVTLLHVVESSPLLGFHTVDYTSETLFRDSEEKAEKDLDRIIREQTPFPAALAAAVRRGDAQKEIVRFAVEENVDLIVMATHGRTGLAHIMLGSVAERVVRRSPVPVVTVKPPEMRERLILGRDIEEQLHFKP